MTHSAYSFDPIKNAYQQNNSQHKKSAGKMILSVFFSILFFLELTLLIILGNIRSISSEKTVKYIVKQADIAEINMADFTSDSSEEIPLYQYIYSYTSTHPELSGLSEKDIRDILQDSDVSDFTSDKLSEYANYFMTGDGNPSITNEEILGLIDQEAVKYTGDSLSQPEKAALDHMLDDMGVESIDISHVTEEYEEEFKTLHTITSNKPYILIICFIGLTLLFLWVLNLDCKRRSLLFSGIPAVLVGLIFTACSFIPKFVSEYISMPSSVSETYLKNLITNVALDIRFCSLIIFGVGMILITLNLIFKIIDIGHRKYD